MDHVPKPARFAVLEESGISQRQAAKLAGYAPSTTVHTIKSGSAYQQYKQTIRQQRAELAAKRGYTLNDSAKFYKEKSENKRAEQLRQQALDILQANEEGAAETARIYLEEAAKLDVSDPAQIRARERLDRLLGFDSPLEVEQDSCIRDVSPIVELVEMLQQLKMSPIEARAWVEEDPPNESEELPSLPDATSAADEGEEQAW